MKKSSGKNTSPRVALLIESSRSYGRELLMGIARYLRIHGPWIIEFEEGDPSECLPQWFNRWKWHGIIARVSTPAMAETLRRTGAPVIDMSGSLPETGFPKIRSDEVAVGRLACEHLLERGFKNFAFCGFNGIGWSDMRRDSFLQRVAQVGLDCHIYPNLGHSESYAATDYDQNGESQQRELIAWLQSLPKPCGIMACNDARGREVLTCCREVEIVVPDEVAVIGVDKDEIFCELSNLPLSSVILNTKQIGFEAASLLAKMMAGERPTCLSILVPPIGVMARQSTDVLAIEDTHIATALRHIREQACEHLNVDSILKSVPLSRSVLERRFAQILGTSPKAEILRVRLARVCRLLAESDLTLSQIAEKAGFEHPEYMSRIFKKKIGITPGEYRKKSSGISEIGR